MPNKYITKSDYLYEFTNTKYKIESNAFDRLIKILSMSLEKFKYPRLYRVIVYLKSNDIKISSFMDEMQRHYVNGDDECPKLIYFWAKEYAKDDTHSGLHYHLILIGEGRGVNKDYFVKKRITRAVMKLKKLDWIWSYDDRDPYNSTTKADALRSCVSDKNRCSDLLRWLSYNCKAESKELVLGRRYGSTPIIKGCPNLELGFLADDFLVAA